MDNTIPPNNPINITPSDMNAMAEQGLAALRRSMPPAINVDLVPEIPQTVADQVRLRLQVLTAALLDLTDEDDCGCATPEAGHTDSCRHRRVAVVLDTAADDTLVERVRLLQASARTVHITALVMMAYNGDVEGVEDIEWFVGPDGETEAERKVIELYAHRVNFTPTGTHEHDIVRVRERVSDCRAAFDYCIQSILLPVHDPVSAALPPYADVVLPVASPQTVGAAISQATDAITTLAQTHDLPPTVAAALVIDRLRTQFNLV